VLSTGSSVTDFILEAIAERGLGVIAFERVIRSRDMKPTHSYPYLQIARIHGVDYSDVLKVVDVRTHGRHAPDVSEAWGRLRSCPDPDRLLHDVELAVAEFAVIRREGWD